MAAPQHADRDSERFKLGGLKRRQIVRELAFGEFTQQALADKYEVSQPAIAKFKARHADEIEAVRADAEDEFAGILIAQKAARLASLAEIHEKAMKPVPKVGNNGKVVERINPETGERETLQEWDGRLAAQVLKQAAEEMGQLPTRVQVSGDMQTTTTYRIENVSNDDLT
jgi:hypothetical protein